LRDGCRLAARVSGDSAVAFSWAYCRLWRECAGRPYRPRALHLRALCLELERCRITWEISARWAMMPVSRLDSRSFRAQGAAAAGTQAAFGQRYLLDIIVPGGLAETLRRRRPGALSCGAYIARSVRELRKIYWGQREGAKNTPACVIVFVGPFCQVRPARSRAARLSVLAGRASGLRLICARTGRGLRTM